MPVGRRGVRARARRGDMPIFLSVGYSSCHWCHVMAHESFEDDATAALMNRLFVNVKVDREERPDVDAIYMQAVQALTGRGGWPMTRVVHARRPPVLRRHLLPRRGPPRHAVVHARVRGGGRGLARPARRRRGAGEQAHRGASTRTCCSPRRRAAEVLTPTILDDAYAQGRARSSSRAWGGFGRAPKFPQAMTIDFLCREYVRNGARRDARR